MNVIVGSGNSMHPIIRDGEQVLFTRSASAVVGAIGVFPDVVHRIVRIEGDGTLWEKGEGLVAWPRARRTDELQGIATAVVRDGVILDLKQPPRALALTWAALQTRLPQRSRRARAAVLALRVAGRLRRALRAARGLS